VFFLFLPSDCIAAERFYVQSGIHDKFVAEVVKRVKSLEQGASACGEDGVRCDFGAITMAQQINVFTALIDDAVAKGAKLLCGGKRYTVAARTAKGVYFQPTILANVDHSMRIANEEAFGPVMILLKFDKEEEAVAMANCTEFGLGSSVFTTDYARADRVSTALECGMTTVNDFGMVPMVQSLPFGGVRSSGFGAFNGREGLQGFSRTHAVVTDRFPVRSQTPGFLQYPVSKEAHRIAQAGVSMIYGPSWSNSASALARMIKHIMRA